MPIVHIHGCRLDQHRAELAMSAAILSADELARGARYRVDAAREEFLLARILTRRILAGYLARPPASLVFVPGAHGKPGLRQSTPPPPEFNVSHSHGWLLVAVRACGPVGIDIERIDPAIDPLELALQALPPFEIERLRAVEGDTRLARFHQSWTRWEAYLKATGDGLAAAVPAPDLLAETADGLLLPTADGSHHALIRDLPAPPGFKAALAVIVAPGSSARLDIVWHGDGLPNS